MTGSCGDDHIAMCSVKSVRQNDQTAARLARLGGDGFFNRRVVVHRSKRHCHPEGRGGGLDRAVEQWGVRRGVRVEDDGDPRDTWRDLLEQLEPFSHHRRVNGAEPGDVAAGPREALNKAQPDGIAHEYENDRYRARLLLQRRDRRRGACENCVRRQADQFCRIGLEESWIARGKAVVDPDILTLDPPETPQRLHKGRHICLSERVVLGESDQHANAANPLGLLGVPGERPCRRPAERGDERAPP